MVAALTQKHTPPAQAQSAMVLSTQPVQAAASLLPPPPPPPPAEQLPAGWQAAFSETGERYYIDHTTQTTHWHLPPKFLPPPSYNHQQSTQPVGGMPYYPGGGDEAAAFAAMQGAYPPSSVRGIDNTKRKTKLCIHNHQGACPWGDRCAFAHHLKELVGLGK